LNESINGDTLNLYGSILRRQGFPAIAALLCRQAATLEPSHPYAIINEALAMEALGKVKNAINLAVKAVEKGHLDAWGNAAATRLIEIEY